MKKLLLIIPFLLFNGCSVGSNLMYINEGETPKMKITILDQQSFNKKSTNGIELSELSDLAYDVKNHKLYAVGDKGNFYIFNALFKEKIEQLVYIKGFKLREEKSEKYYDSEGLTFNNKGQLYLSFEKYPRITTLTKEGYIKKNQKLPKKLRDKKNYKHANAIFEALAWHPKYGLLTAAEYPMFKKRQTNQTIYSLKGREWHFKAQNDENSAITAMEVMDDGNVLVLERAYAGLSKPIVITLKKVYLNKCNKKSQCKTDVLASFNSFNGWSVANYEGLTKISKNRYLMVSDNGNKEYLSTTFVYFEVNK